MGGEHACASTGFPEAFAGSWRCSARLGLKNTCSFIQQTHISPHVLVPAQVRNGSKVDPYSPVRGHLDKARNNHNVRQNGISLQERHKQVLGCGEVERTCLVRQSGKISKRRARQLAFQAREGGRREGGRVGPSTDGREQSQDERAGVSLQEQAELSLGVWVQKQRAGLESFEVKGQMRPMRLRRK